MSDTGTPEYQPRASTDRYGVIKVGSGLTATDGVLSTSGGSAAPVGASYVTLATDGTLTDERVLTGTANQITIQDNGAGSTVVVSTPQNIHTAATPTFASLNLTADTNQLVLDSNGNATTITAPATGARTITTPDATTTLVGIDVAQTLTNKTIALGSNTVSGTTAQFNTALSDNDFATLAGSETLTNKTIALGSNTISGTTAQFNTALSDNDFATLAGSETLTNKTINLTSNTLSGTTAQFNTALSDNDFATLAGSETLTNKTINLTSNTLSGTTAQFNTALSDNDFATLAGSETLTNKTLTAPKFADGGFLADANGNEMLILDSNASAVNEFTISNGATGVNPVLSATGETNVGLDFQAKGTGVYNFKGTASQAAEIRLFEDTDDGTNYTSFKSPALSANVNYTLPSNDGDASQFLQTDGSGALTWATPSASSTPRIYFASNCEDVGSANVRFGHATTGTGTVTNGVGTTGGGFRMKTGATAGSTAEMYSTTVDGGNLAGTVFNDSPEVQWMGQFINTTTNNFIAYFIGFAAGISPSSSAALTSRHIGFILDTTVLYGSNANGTSQTKTDITGSVDVTVTNILRATQTGSTNVKFYTNKTLAATHTTNLASGDSFGYEWAAGVINDGGVTTDRYMIMQNFTLSLDGA